MALRERAGRDWGSNLSRVKDYNEVVVFHVVRNSGRYALGIQVVRGRLAVGVVDLAGVVRGCAETTFEVDEAPARVVERFLPDLVDEALHEAAVPRERILAAAVASPGPLDVRRGVLLNVLNPPSWSHFDMRSAVEAALGVRVIVDNDATAAAMGERWSGSGAHAEHFVYVYLGRGLGTGLVLRGRPYRGLRGRFTEHLRAGLDDLAEPGAPPPGVEVSHIGAQAGVIGAARMVLHDLNAPTTRKLSLVDEPSETRGRRRAA